MAQSNGRCLAIPKEMVRSHGNGAVLLHKKAIKKLIDPFIALATIQKKLAPVIASVAN